MAERTQGLSGLINRTRVNKLTNSRKRTARLCLRAFLPLVLVSLMLLPCFCSSGPISAVDDEGKTIEFDAPVKSIISLAPSCTEIVYALGAQDKLIGRTDFCNYPPEAEQVQSIGAFESPNQELILTLEPDVVLAANLHIQLGITAWFESKGIKVVTLDPYTLEDVLDNITLVGKIAGRDSEARDLVSSLRTRIEAVEEKVEGLTEAQRRRVLHVTWHEPLYTAGTGTFIHALIETAGGVNVFADLSGHPVVGLDEAVMRNPDIITVFSAHGTAGDQSYEYVRAASSPFKDTEAHKNQRVYLIDADLASRGGPRLVDALEEYAQIIPPELFG